MKRAAAALLAVILLIAPAWGEVHRDRETVIAVQQALNAAGFHCGYADGIPGNQTAGAILAYQAANALPRTGLINDRLLFSLGLEADPMVRLEFTAFPPEKTNSIPCLLTDWYETAASRAALTALLSRDLAQAGGTAALDPERTSFVGVSGNRLFISGWDAAGTRSILIVYSPAGQTAHYACADASGDAPSMEAVLQMYCDVCSMNDAAFLGAAGEAISLYETDRVGGPRALTSALGLRPAALDRWDTEYGPVMFSFRAGQADAFAREDSSWFQSEAGREQFALALCRDQVAAAGEDALCLSPAEPLFIAAREDAVAVSGWNGDKSRVVLILYYPDTGCANCGALAAPGVDEREMTSTLTQLCGTCVPIDRSSLASFP